MVRSTAIGWQIGLAVAVAALSLWQLPARAQEAPPEKVEAPPQPIEQKTVKIILLPPADDAVFALRRPEPAGAVSVVSVESTPYGAVALPSAEPAEIQDDAETAEIPALVERPSLATMPPASDAAVVQPRLETAKVQENAAPVEIDRGAVGSPRVASVQPPARDIVAPPRAESAKIPQSATLVQIPSVPARSPFRRAAAKTAPVEAKTAPVENEWKSATTLQEQAPEPAPVAKGNSAFRFLTNLWPGNKQASAQVSPATSSAPPQQSPAEARPASETPTAKPKPAYLLDVLQFWKK
jgi:hypothetical protein